MDEDRIARSLDRLAQKRAKLRELEIELAAEEDRIMAKVQPKIEELRGDYMERTADIATTARDLEEKIKSAVLPLKHHVNGQILYAQYKNPAVRWNYKMLEGLMIAIPRLKKARKEDPLGQVAICVVKQ